MPLILTGTSSTTTLDSSAGLTFSDSSNQAAAASPNVLKNRIINGAMQVWQRGTSFSTTGLYGADRWKMQLVGTTTLSQETSVIPAGSQYALKWTTGASSSYGQIRQWIETVNLYDLRGQTVTASAQVRCNATFSGNLQFEIGYATTGDASTESYTVISGTSTGTVNSSGYTTITWTGTIPSNTLGLYVGIVPSVVQASGAIAYMGNVQLEQNTSATPFERRLISQELALCQRYYQTYSPPPLRGVVVSGTAWGRAGMVLPVVMRAAPTVAIPAALPFFDGTNVGTSSNITTNFSTATVVELDLVATTGTLTGGRPLIAYQGAGGQLTVSAEL
jgi:hypothetical protein